jgi:arylsulfatase A-like enzyme
MDVFPTLTELAGIAPKSGISGRSIVPLLRDPSAEWDHPVVSVYGDGHYSVIHGDWHYIRYAQGGEELYNLAADPHEWENLAAVADQASRIAEMASFIPAQRAPLVPTKSIRWEHVLDGTGDLYDPGG